MLFSRNDVRKLNDGETYKNKFVILNNDKINTFREEFQNLQNQLFYATDGFGCDPTKLGNAVFGCFCSDGEHCRIERYDILGVATDEALEQWKHLYGEPITE